MEEGRRRKKARRKGDRWHLVERMGYSGKQYNLVNSKYLTIYSRKTGGKVLGMKEKWNLAAKRREGTKKRIMAAQGVFVTTNR